MPDGQLSDPTDPTPPLSEAERLDRLRLIRSRRVGPVTFHRLLAEHGSGRAALAALPSLARASGAEGYAPCPEGVAMAEILAGRRLGARLICLGEEGYPAALAALPDAPPLIWLRGNAGLLQRPMLALVGARNASSLGLRMARRLAGALGEAGFTLVSGLARGIDREAHLASLATGTVAVQPGGIEIAAPEENAGLLDDIRRQGLVLSEHPPGLQPQARHFPLRNRLVAGLSQAVLVVEAAARSGSLITARMALDLGREVMAVPGHPFDARAAGCNMLIRDGAALLRDAADVFEALGLALPAAEGPRVVPRSPLAEAQPAAVPEPSRTGSLSDITRLHNLILGRLGPSPLPEDQLIRDLAMPPAGILPELLTLELEGRIRRQPGGLLSRA